MSIGDRLARALGGVSTGMNVYLGLKRDEQEQARLDEEARRRAEIDRLAMEDRLRAEQERARRDEATQGAAQMLYRQNPDRFASVEEAEDFLRSGAPMGMLPERQEPFVPIPPHVELAYVNGARSGDLSEAVAAGNEWVQSLPPEQQRYGYEALQQMNRVQQFPATASRGGARPAGGGGSGGPNISERRANGAVLANSVNMTAAQLPSGVSASDLGIAISGLGEPDPAKARQIEAFARTIATQIDSALSSLSGDLVAIEDFWGALSPTTKSLYLMTGGGASTPPVMPSGGLDGLQP